jgi:hypothetical protein
VRELSQKEAVIFASGASGITNFAHVADKRVAFGQTNSTISFLAKVHFARAGIRAVDLQSYVHLSGIKPDRDQDPSQPNGSADRDSETQAHKRVIEAVGLGRADILNLTAIGGVASWNFTPIPSPLMCMSSAPALIRT